MKLKQYINESSLSRVWRHVTKHDSGTISAYRYVRNCGKGDRYTRAEKKKRNNILKSRLLRLGYGVTDIRGVYIENYKSDNEIRVKEESFIVVDIDDTGNLKRDLMKLGEEFEQDSITFSKSNGEYYLIGTNHCDLDYIKFGESVKLGKSFFGKDGEIFSRVNGRPFIFESIDNKVAEMKYYSIAELRSIRFFSEEDVS